MEYLDYSDRCKELSEAIMGLAGELRATIRRQEKEIQALSKRAGLTVLPGGLGTTERERDVLDQAEVITG